LNDTIPLSEAAYETGHNLVLNDTDDYEDITKMLQIHLTLNGKGSTLYKRREVKLVGHRCIGSCVEDIVEVATETDYRYWSDPNAWESGSLPVEGEDVHILSGWNMVLDIPETPILQLLRVNGKLSFKNNTDIHLRAKHIFVRAGELHIGGKDYPFQKQARITLFGEHNS
jgi:hypothetical protein